MGRHRLGLLLGLLLVVSSATARVPGEGGIYVRQSGNDLGATGELDFDPTDFTATRSADGSIGIVLGANVTEVGATVGDSCTDFPNIAAGGVDMSCTALELPNGTSSVSADCDSAGEFGRVWCDSDNTTTAPCFFCLGAGGWWQMGDILGAGRSGGQTVAGGTAATDNLALKPTSASNYTGQIHACTGVGTITTGGNVCLVTFPDGFTTDLNGVGEHVTSYMAGGTITQSGSAGVLAAITGFGDFSGRKTSGSVTTQVIQRSFFSTPTLTNDTANNVTIARTALFEAQPLYVKSSTGTLTVTNHYTLLGDLQTIPAGVTITDLYAGGDVDTFTNSGTITRLWGWHVDALSAGTANFQYGATEHTPAGVVPSAEVVWGSASGSPGRFYTRNENQQQWDMGYTSWTGSTGAALAADNTTRYFPVNDRAETDGAANVTFGATITEGEHDVPAPGALKVFAMVCAVNVAPANGGGTQTRTFTLREAGAGVAPTCTISEAATSCTWCVAPTGTPCSTTATGAEAVAAGALVDIEAAAASTPAASDATCTTYWTLDAF